MGTDVCCDFSQSVRENLELDLEISHIRFLPQYDSLIFTNQHNIGCYVTYTIVNACLTSLGTCNCLYLFVSYLSYKK
jgi:hypothetical protein